MKIIAEIIYAVVLALTILAALPFAILFGIAFLIRLAARRLELLIFYKGDEETRFKAEAGY